jgi:hypothetical protein
MDTKAARARAYAQAKTYGLTIDYEVGARRWTANVCAPEGMEFEPGLTMLCTSWLTKPTADFWLDVVTDIQTYGPSILVKSNA